MNVVTKNEGPIETTIVSEDSDPLGQGVFEVKVTTAGVELRPLGGEWKAISFSEFQLFDARIVMADCNYLLGQYEHDARDRIAQLQQKLEDVRRSLALELRTKCMRKLMRAQ